MNDAIIRFPTGHFSLARMVYFTDLRRGDSPIIPIGVVAEVTLDGLHGIGAALRPGLDPADLERVGPWMRDILSHPVDTLWREMEEAFQNGPAGTALQTFSSRHQSSLSVLAPQALDVPKQWLLEKDWNFLESLVSARLKMTLTEQYYELLFPPRTTGLAHPTVRDDVRTAKAA